MSLKIRNVALAGSAVQCPGGMTVTFDKNGDAQAPVDCGLFDNDGNALVPGYTLVSGTPRLKEESPNGEQRDEPGEEVEFSAPHAYWGQTVTAPDGTNLEFDKEGKAKGPSNCRIDHVPGFSRVEEEQVQPKQPVILQHPEGKVFETPTGQPGPGAGAVYIPIAREPRPAYTGPDAQTVSVENVPAPEASHAAVVKKPVEGISRPVEHSDPTATVDNVESKPLPGVVDSPAPPSPNQPNTTPDVTREQARTGTAAADVQAQGEEGSQESTGEGSGETGSSETEQKQEQNPQADSGPDTNPSSAAGIGLPSMAPSGNLDKAKDAPSEAPPSARAGGRRANPRTE